MTRKTFVVGEVTAAPSPHSGYVVNLLRYASGRLLPAPRLVLADGVPFSSRLAALDALVDYQRTGVMPARCALPAPAPKARKSRARRRTVTTVAVTPVKMMSYADLLAIDAKRPPVVKMMSYAPIPFVKRKLKSHLAAEQLIALSGITPTQCGRGLPSMTGRAHG